MHDAAPADLEALGAVDAATLLLYDMLVDTEAAADMDSVDGRRKMALAHLSTIMLRTSRACMRVIGTGYVQEAVALKRRITEAAHHTEKLRTDAGGEYAKQWLAGKASASGKLARSVGQSERQWNFYSRGAHADARILPTEPRGEQVKVLLTPDRDRAAANALLTELAIELADQVGIVARELRDAALVGQEQRRLDGLNRQIEVLKERWYVGVSEGLDEMARIRTRL